MTFALAREGHTTDIESGPELTLRTSEDERGGVRQSLLVRDWVGGVEREGRGAKERVGEGLGARGLFDGKSSDRKLQRGDAVAIGVCVVGVRVELSWAQTSRLGWRRVADQPMSLAP